MDATDWVESTLVSGSVGDGSHQMICKVLSSLVPSLTFHLPEVIERNNKVKERRLLDIS